MSAIKQLLSYREVQAVLGVCRETVRRLAAEGKLRAIPAGSRNVRFRRREVEKLAEKGWR